MNFHPSLNIISLDKVDSTNNYANRLILKDKSVKHTVIMTKYQTSGKGQQNNGWLSQAEKNLMFSLILRPTFLSPSKQFIISKIISIAIVEFLKTHNVNATIKWPNDIYVNDKKIAGILIESTILGNSIDNFIIGVGININQTKFDRSLPNPISLKNIINKTINLDAALSDILELFYRYYHSLELSQKKMIDDRYLTLLYRKDGYHPYKRANTIFEAKIYGIGSYGQLILKERDNQISEYHFKEVEFVLDSSN